MKKLAGTPGELGGRWVLAPLLAVAIAACGGPPSAPPPAPERPHVLLISLDTLRADRLGCYGYARDTSPFLDELARGGVLFRHAFVNTHGTPPSHATLFTSLYQESHRVSWRHRDGSPDHRLPEDLPILPEVLREAGYATVAITGGGFMAEEFGFARGFDSFIEDGLEDGARRLVRQIEKRLDGRPVFAFFHTYEIHSPYDPPRPHRDRWGPLTDIDASSKHLQDLIRAPGPVELPPDDLHTLNALYDAGIRHTDEVLRGLFARLDEIGFLEHAVVVVTSDHGEEFGEHGGLLHPAQLYDELLAVPLIMTGPGLPPGRVDRRLVSTLDIAPTLYGLTGVRKPRIAAGRDLFAANAEPGEQLGGGQPIFSQYGDLLLSVRTEKYKLIENLASGAVRLYDLEEDPGETRNLAARLPDVKDDLRAQLHAWHSGLWRPRDTRGESQDLSQERLEQLKALGYLSD